MARWLTIFALLGSAASGWASGGAAELHRQIRVGDFWKLLGKIPESAEVVREAGRRAAAAGDAGLCRALLVEGALQFPNGAGLLYYELGEGMRKLGREGAAISAFRRALELRTGLRVSFGYVALASLHEDRGEVEEAWQAFQDLAADEDALAVHVAEAAIFALRHGKPDAGRLFEVAVEIGTKEGPEMEARVLRRWADLQSGEAALALYERLHAGTETKATDFQRAGVLAAELNQEKRSDSFFREGMERHPEARGWLRYEFAVQLEKAGRLQEALEAYRSAKEAPEGLKPGFAYVGLAKLLETGGKAEEAAGVMEELLGSKHALAVHLAEAGGFESRQGRIERALGLYLQAFQRALEEEEQVAVGNILSEGMETLPGLKDLALWFRKGTEDLPQEEKTRVRRALATTFGNHSWKLLNEKSFAEAEISAEMALEIFAPDVLKWVEGNRAHACLFQGRLSEAWQIHQRYQDEQLELDGLDWRKAAREDFKTFREAGLVTAEAEVEIRKLERLLGIEGAPEPEAGKTGTAK